MTQKVDSYEKLLRDLIQRVGAVEQRLIRKALEQVSAQSGTWRRGNV